LLFPNNVETLPFPNNFETFFAFHWKCWNKPFLFSIKTDKVILRYCCA
jgi:hypothetical protein